MSHYTTDWLGLREPADAEARSTALVDRLTDRLSARPAGRAGLVISDLGCGSGSMARWLSPKLPVPQRWILVDHDPALLAYALEHIPQPGEARELDLTRLDPADLAGSDLVTASALLDILTAEGVQALVEACAGIPALLTLSVVGEVRLHPEDPLDAEVAAAFDAHQRRDGRLGPDAAAVTAAAFGRSREVVVADSPWRLAGHPALTAEWLKGWVGAAAEQRPELDTAGYLARRLAEPPEVTVGHRDLLII
jgi:SAM-dependent methyltransferase